MKTVDDVRSGLVVRDRRSLARALSWIEAADPRGAQSVSGTTPPPAAHVVGITGAPGAGKSTLTSRLISEIRAAGYSVAVLAVDPTSPLSGGSLLGDRIRMAEHTHDPEVYIRSMASRGQSGGLSRAVPAVLQALHAFGFDWVLVETVGVGQIEIDVAQQADTTVVVLVPGLGDDVQASKAGVLEIADLFVVNKADRPGAADTALEIGAALELSPRRGWRPPVVQCSAEQGAGIEDVWKSLQEHRQHLLATDTLTDRRRQRRISELRRAVRELAATQAGHLLEDESAQPVVTALLDGRADLADAASMLLSQWRPRPV